MVGNAVGNAEIVGSWVGGGEGVCVGREPEVEKQA